MRRTQASQYIVASCLLAAIVFAVLNGVEEFQTAFTSMHPRPSVSWLFSEFFVRETTRAAPYGLIVAALLSIPILVIGLKLRKAGINVNLSASTFGGAIIGAILSFIIYLCVGGWAPPFFFETVACGAVLGGTIKWFSRRP